ncbi:TraB/GumN family protein [Candidatus Woesearchaeota archaeon]|nr:TraB/GumN family protein [Candidatus Woesearchaeota archaeon]
MDTDGQYWIKRLREITTPLQQKLPFVWELAYEKPDGKKIVSCAVATKHDEPKTYTRDIARLLESIKRACFEITPDIPTHQETIDIQLATLDAYHAFRESCADSDLKTKVMQLAARIFGIHTPEEFRAGILPGVDGNIMDVARTQSIPCYALETHEERYPYLVKVHQALQIGLMLARLKPEFAKCDVEMLERMLNEADAAYQSGDEQALRVQKIRPAQEPLVIKRNQLMAYRSLEHLVAVPTLIAVGYAHFIGPEPSMLTLYQEKGIKVKRIQ